MATIRRKSGGENRRKSGKMPRIITKTSKNSSAKTKLQKITGGIIPAAINPKNPIEKISNFREKTDFTKKIKLFSLYCIFFSLLLVVFECSLVSIFDIIVQGNFTEKNFTKKNYFCPPSLNYELLYVEKDENIVDFTCIGCEVNVQKELP